MPLCRTLLGSLFGDHNFTPACPCELFQEHVHRVSEKLLEGHAIVEGGTQPYGKEFIPGAVTRPLSKKEILNDPRAKAAIKKEGDSLQAVGTWDLNSVIEEKELEAWAKEQERKNPSYKVHFGGLLTLCRIQHAESRNPADWLHKGRICFVGNQVFDQHGIRAAFDYISASPTGVHSSNSNLF